MIAKHDIQTNHLFQSDKGAELYIELDSTNNKSTVMYRMDRDHAKITLEADSLTDLVDLLNEAVTIITPTPAAQG